MKLFISWSGDSSRAVAQALREWIPCVIQAVKPWMSKHDLSSGSRWALDIAKELSETRVGLICLTPDNLSAPWLLFEAGALSKTLDSDTLVCTYLVGLKPADVGDPLGQFQATVADKEGTHKLLKDINEKLDQKVAEHPLNMTFEALWPQLQAKLQAAANLKPIEKRRRNERELLEEILSTVRQLARADSERWKSDPAEFRRMLFELYSRELAAQPKDVAVPNPPSMDALAGILGDTPPGPTGPAGLGSFAAGILGGAGPGGRESIPPPPREPTGASNNRATVRVSHYKPEPIPKREE